MRFSTLITALQQGQAGLKRAESAADPLLSGAASLDQAGPGQLSFLEKGNALTVALGQSAVGAVLLPDQEDLIALDRALAYAEMADPRLGAPEALELLIQRRMWRTMPAPVDERAVVGPGVAIGPRVHWPGQPSWSRQRDPSRRDF